MKKIAYLIALFFAFTLTTNAQDKKTEKLDPATMAKADVEKLSQAVKLENNLPQDIFNLFETKHKMLAQVVGNVERTKEIHKIIEMKLRATFNAEQMAAIEAKAGLLKDLVD